MDWELDVGSRETKEGKVREKATSGHNLRQYRDMEKERDTAIVCHR